MSEVLDRPTPTTSNAENTRLMRFLGRDGHLNIGWDKENDDDVIPVIRGMLERGVTFWVLKSGWLKDRQVRLQNIEQIGEDRQVMIHDDDARSIVSALKNNAKLLVDERIDNASDASEKVVISKKAGDTPETLQAKAAQVAGSDSIGHRAMRGG